MSIQFRCDHCGKQVVAPDSAGGQRGKCPYCNGSNYIPAPVGDDELVPLAPLDEGEERRRQKEIDSLFLAEREILAESGGPPAVPLEQREDLQVEDLHHFVVNYCLDMGKGNLSRARRHVESLRQYGTMGAEAVNDYLTGKTKEPALNTLPPKVLQGFLTQLRGELKSGF
ncbi:MAG: RNHCP domain-containing protein [Phycisphaerae bacterium]|nr:RNHCP domain-containing protein [Phycisphaerae bacterium]